LAEEKEQRKYEKDEKRVAFSSETLKTRDHLKDLDVDKGTTI
jgi:hypothetical protein